MEGMTPRDANIDVPAKSIWVRHVHPEMFLDEPGDHLRDIITHRLDRFATAMGDELVRSHDWPPDEALATISNIILEHALNLQREHAPGEQKAMIVSLLADDPALEDVRDELFAEMRRIVESERGEPRVGLLGGLALLAGGLLIGLLLPLPALFG